MDSSVKQFFMHFMLYLYPRWESTLLSQVSLAVSSRSRPPLKRQLSTSWKEGASLRENKGWGVHKSRDLKCRIKYTKKFHKCFQILELTANTPWPLCIGSYFTVINLKSLGFFYFPIMCLSFWFFAAILSQFSNGFNIWFYFKVSG